MWFWKRKKKKVEIPLAVTGETNQATGVFLLEPEENNSKDKMEDKIIYVDARDAPESEFDYLRKLIMHRAENYFHAQGSKAQPPDIFKIKKCNLQLLDLIFATKINAEE